MKLKYFLIPLFLFIPLAVSAHQPRIVSGNEINEIKNPDISQAFYGELKGEPAIYEIKSEAPFSLYLGLLVPDLPNQRKDFSARVVDEKEDEVFILDGQNFIWQGFYEEFGGDYYLKGPENKIGVGSGAYLVTVSNPDDQGKYVLVVGEKEIFPAGEILNTIITLPQLKKNFFLKSPLTAFSNKIGLYLRLFFLTIIVLIWLVVFIIKRLRRGLE
jgi:hypothetical protein